MKILELSNDLLAEIRFLNAGRSPGAYTEEPLPVHWGRVSELPDQLDALLVTADLQGRATFRDAASIRQQPVKQLLYQVTAAPLLGEALPWLLDDVFRQLAACGVELNDRKRVGVILAGDFYTVPDLSKRGGTGDVTGVWTALADEFRWVAGVAGNHDLFRSSSASSLSSAGRSARKEFGRRGNMDRPAANALPANAHYLDGDHVLLDSLTIAGLSGIIGKPSRVHRREHDHYLEDLSRLLDEPCELLVMHEGPNHRSAAGSLLGIEEIRELLELAAPCLIVRGHCHWPTPLITLDNASQVLNVDGRVVLLTR